MDLLNVGNDAQEHGQHVEGVPHDVQQVPHVPDILPEALRANLLDLLPQESYTSARGEGGRRLKHTHRNDR